MSTQVSPIRKSNFTCHKQGAVFVLTLLALSLIAAVVFYVLNVGKHIQGRVSTQNATDAAALAGASEIARTFNTIAMNNTEIARKLAAINIIDAIPRSLDFTVTTTNEEEQGDLSALHTVLQYQLYEEGPHDVWYKALLQRALMGHRASTSTVLPQLLELTNLYTVESENIKALTHYKHPSLDIHGDMWESIYSMYNQNMGMLDSLNERMQLATWEAARSNIRTSRDAGGVILPLTLQVPIMKGHFYDFERPIRYGTLPGEHRRHPLIADSIYIGFGETDDSITNRGPWDTVFGWRRINGNDAGVSTSTGGPGSPPIRRQITSEYQEPTEYTVSGPQAWLRGKLYGGSSIEHPGAYHLLDEYISSYSQVKLNMLFGGPTELVLKPDWEIDISSDDSRIGDNNTYCRDDFEKNKVPHKGLPGKSLYLVCEMKSRFATNPGLSSAQGQTWNFIDRSMVPYPYLTYANSYHPDRTNGPQQIPSQYIRSQKAVNKHVYQIKAWYQTNPEGYEHGGDPDIGLPPRIIGRNPDGSYVYAAQTVFWNIYYVYVATNWPTLPPVEIRNPHAGFNPELETSPAPVDFVHENMTPETDTTKKRLQMLCITYQNDQAEVWPKRFDRNRPYGNMVGLSQVKLFNNHSWDLWTQMWHAQLEPINDYAVWADEYNEGDVLNIEHEDPEVLFELGRYLESVKAMSDFGRH
ncbi:hypothetical protein JD969_06550 [Planctomycetota bacterium]|nr:hypothetical protein JD969_06550 [Planctomycetota bacterium]